MKRPRRDSTAREQLNDIKHHYMPGTTRDANDIRRAVRAEIEKKARGE